MPQCYIDPNLPIGYDALTPYILPWVLGAPTELLVAQARLAAIELCRRSGVLHDVNYIDLQKNVREYFIETLCDYESVRVYEISMLGQWTFRPSIQRPIRNTGVPFNTVGYWGSTWWCGPYSFYMHDPSTVFIQPATQQDFEKGLRIEFVVQPKQDSCVLDNYLYEFWAEGIAAGAISRLKMIKDTNWYDPAGAAFYRREFEKAIGRARGTVDMNFTSGPVRMQAERWV